MNKGSDKRIIVNNLALSKCYMFMYRNKVNVIHSSNEFYTIIRFPNHSFKYGH